MKLKFDPYSKSLEQKLREQEKRLNSLLEDDPGDYQLELAIATNLLALAIESKK